MGSVSRVLSKFPLLFLSLSVLDRKAKIEKVYGRDLENLPSELYCYQIDTSLPRLMAL